LKSSLLFTVGPVEMDDAVRQAGGRPLPYFRTQEFSHLMLGLEASLRRCVRASEGSRALILTASGSGAMEAAVVNLFDRRTRVLVVDSGSFGARFVRICEVHGIPHDVLKLEDGVSLTEEALRSREASAFDGMLINVHETSTGVLHDMEMVGAFCRRRGLLLVADAVSTFLADEYEMERWGIDVSLLSSQKALALPPGLSMVVVDERAVKAIEGAAPPSLYFDLRCYLADMERGQTPFTPAVGIILQLAERLEALELIGVERERERIAALAADFRTKIAGLPLEIAADRLSNALTPLRPLTMSAQAVFERLRRDHDITVLPSGGHLRDTLFRVGHLGTLTVGDNDRLVAALTEIFENPEKQEGGRR